MKKTLLIFSLVLTISAPTLLEMNAYKDDPTLLKLEETVDSYIAEPHLRHN